MKKQDYFYFECDTVHGRSIIRVETESKLLNDLIEAKHDVLHIALYHAERVITHIPRKPEGMTFLPFRGVKWAAVGVKNERKEIED